MDSYSNQNGEFASEESAVTEAQEKVRGLQNSIPNTDFL